MNPEVRKLIEYMETLSPPRPQVHPDDHQVIQLYQTLNLARLSVLLAQEQEKSAFTMERQTNKLILLTWVLASMTAALLFFTVVLYQDTHAEIQRHTLTEHSTLQTPKSSKPTP